MKEAYEKRRREIALKPTDDDELPEQLPPPEPEVVDDDLPPGEPQAAEQPAGALPDEYDNVSDSDSDGAEGTCVFGDRKVRKYAGSERPRNIMPELWKRTSAKQKAEAVAEYKNLKLAKKAKKAAAKGAKDASAADEAAPAVPLINPEVTVPTMPTSQGKTWTHRTKNPLDQGTFFAACVARPVSKAEIKANEKANASLLKEWDKLRKAGTWDESRAQEWSAVAKAAREAGSQVHVGRIFEICVEKGSELPEGDPGRKYKGRVVFQGNQVRDQNFDYAMFDDLGSAPATMAAAKAADAFGIFHGHTIEQADAEQAYIQSKLGGTPTWVRLPPERWPKSWAGLRDPVCPLILALYGHPDSGGYWEQYCNTHLANVGFQAVPQWRSCFHHPKLDLFLTVYVDDFKMSGGAKALLEGWALIRKQIKMEDPTPIGKYLGCEHKVHRGFMPQGGPARGPQPEDTKTNQAAHKPLIPVTWFEYDMSSFLMQCVDKYCELSNLPVSSLKKVETPYLDETKFSGVGDVGEAKTPQEGTLKPIASRILMKVLYAARMCRFDLLRAVSALARYVTKWTTLQDKMLHRLMSYIHHSLERKMFGWIGDKRADLKISLYADADFAGDLETMRSTSGVFLALVGPNSFFPISAISKRQTCVSHSTPEAEIVAADLALRTEGLPALDLWSVLLKRPDLKITFEEDNQAAIALSQNPVTSKRTKHIDIRCHFVREKTASGDIKLEYISTKEQVADLLTKALANAQFLELRKKLLA